MRLTASSRPVGERGADQAVFQQQHRPQRAAAEDGHGQQRAAGDVGEVRVAGEPVVSGGVADDQRFARPLDVAQHRHRHRAFVAGAAGRYGAPPGAGSSQSCRSSSHSSRWTPVAPVIALSTSDHAGVQPADAGLRAQRLRRRQDPEQVDRSGRDGGAAMGKIGGLLAGGWRPRRLAGRRAG